MMPAAARRRRPRLRLLLPAPPLLALLCLGWRCPVLQSQTPEDHDRRYPYPDDDTESLLEPVFEQAFRNFREPIDRFDQPVTHARIAAQTGSVLVQDWETPWDDPAAVGPWRGDAMTVLPAAGEPASVTFRLALAPEHHGINRLQAFVRLSAARCELDGALLNATVGNRSAPGWSLANVTWTAECESVTCCPVRPAYDDSAGALTAWVARYNDAAAVVRDVPLSTIDHMGEWLEVGGDFYLLPDEDPPTDSAAIFLRLGRDAGEGAATEGTASITGVRLTPVPIENVAWLKPLVGAPEPAGDSARAEAVLTNGVFDGTILGETWYQIVGMGEEVSFSVELFGTFRVCSTVVQFSPGTQTYEYEFFLSAANQGGIWDSVLLVDQKADLDAHIATAGTATGWAPSSDERFFDCQLAKRMKLTLRETNNFIYSMSELALYGYDMGKAAPCEKRCRHGGTCRYYLEPCTCVPKWGWRGRTCATDIDECEVMPSTPVATDLSIAQPNGGCARGDFSRSRCTNSNGGWSCTCYHGFAGTPTVKNPEDPPGDMVRECVDINECAAQGPADIAAPPRVNGGCDQICLNLIGAFGAGLGTTHACACQQGFVLLDDNRTCGPRCSQPCQHGSVCVEPEKCRECDDGWQGDYCEFPLCSNEVQVLDEVSGQWVTRLGCYHGGVCESIGECVDCLGGWTGSDCGSFGMGAFISVPLGVGGLVLKTLILLFVAKRRAWVPFQERGVPLVMLGVAGSCVWVGTSPAVANPKLFGIRLVSDDVQPDSRFWSVWLPYSLGFGLWFACILIRMRNLRLIHLQGEP